MTTNSKNLIIAKTAISVRYQETDQMGVAHHSVYPIWFEVGRTDLIKEFGLSYSQLEKEGLFLPLIEINCAYNSFARYEDRLLLISSVNELTFTRISFNYRLVREENDSALIARGKTYHVFTDNKLRPVNLKKYKPEILHTFLNVSSR